MSTSGSKRILIVEEHSFLRRALRRWLETMFPECHVIEAANGQQAIVTVKAGLPDVILLDIHLSGLSSLETRASLIAISPTTPIVVLTGYKVEAHYVRAKEDGTTVYVSRDRTTELRSTLANLLSCQNAPVGDV
jgi:DNA-binding NarL/FixJ family response regulator